MKIIIFAISGIGNAILFTPTLIQLKNKIKDVEITFFARNNAIAGVVSKSKYVDNIINFDDYDFLNKIKLLLSLRKYRYDYSITAFPSNKLQFNLLAYIIRAKNRITHEYKVGKLKTMSFLQNIRIPADEKLHDVEQNLNLLKPFKIQIKKPKKVFFSILRENIDFANKFIKSNNLNRYKVIGIHAGCKKKDKVKRWPENRFIELINRLSSLKKTKIILFSGPDEREAVKRIYEKVKVKPVIIDNSDIKNVAGIIKKCNLLLTTDSSLGHIGAALGKKVIAIFGPTNYIRTRPYGKYCWIVNPRGKPLLKYPFYSTSNKLDYKKARENLKKISVNEVYDKIISLI